MSSDKNTEVYIPKDACVRTVPLQCLPSSIARKIDKRHLLTKSKRSSRDPSQTTTWICPVELREKGMSTCRTAQTCRFLTRGQFRLPVVSSNPMASRILHRFLSPGGRLPQADDPDAPAVCSRVSSYRRNAMVLFRGQIFLTVRKKTTADGQEDHKYGASHKTTEEANENTPTCENAQIREGIQGRMNEQGHGQVEYGADDAESEEEPMRRQAGCPVREECGREGKVEVFNNDDEPMEIAEKAPDPKQQAAGGQRSVDYSHAQKLKAACTSISINISISGELQNGVEAGGALENRGGADVVDGVTAEERLPDDHSFPAESHRTVFPIITNITSLAEGWTGSAGTVIYEEQTALEEHQNFQSSDGPQLTGTAEGSAQTLPPEPSLQENQANGVLPSFMLPPENSRLDFVILEREERILRIRNSLRNQVAKLNTLNSKQ
ncbi:uncharacterized protein si:dkeyp-110g5.4 [Astyanax mexicanus]|uniref:uncharacterized protein si:dkeyp-110g5.4 n=1 Tax=Astyanax mexicanus TaxID=7994 RepID=UPI0020CB59AD|nr:uncharacterized protein si:dkeyp-110g5.4 [Astyanax mexicanus]